VLRVRGGAAFSATVVEFDQEEITVKTERETKSYFWRQLDPRCVYGLVQNHMDKTSAAAHWALAEYCAAAGLSEEARAEYRLCVESDVSYREKADKALQKVEYMGLAGGKGPVPSPVPPPVSLFPQPEPAKPAGRPAQERSHLPENPPAGVTRDAGVVAAQRKNGEKVNGLIGTTLETYETVHLVVHTDLANPAEVDALRKQGESLYAWLYDVLGIHYGDRIWTGKCEVFLFEKREEFIRFAATVDGCTDALHAGGYLRWRGGLCHIAFFKPSREMRDTSLTVLAHELTHAFLEYRVHKGVKPWLNEGLAEYLESVLPEGGDVVTEALRSSVKRITQGGALPRLDDLRARSHVSGSDHDFYVLSWSVVEYMISSDPSHRKFRRFIKALKEGRNEEEAIKEGFGLSPAELEQAWIRRIGSLP
jgi:hypothetical protein